MKIALLTLGFLIGGALLMHLVMQDPGYILISLGEVTLEVTFWFGLFSLVAGYIFVKLLFRLAKRFYQYLAGSVSWISESRAKKAEKRTSSGLIHFVAGDWLAAKKDLLGAAKNVDQPLVHYLAAARSAHELGEQDETLFLLEQAEKNAPEHTPAVALSQARIFLATRQYKQCVAVLEQVRVKLPHHPVVLDLLKQSYIQLKDWSSLVGLLGNIKFAKVYSDAVYQELVELTYCALMDGEMKSDVVNTKDVAAKKEVLEKNWESIPKVIKKNARIVFRYSYWLAAIGESSTAERLLKKSLKNVWHGELIELYGRLHSETPSEQLVAAESWLKDHPEDSDLLLALGRISVRNKLWGKAKDYFEHCLKLKKCPQVYAELAELMAQMGEHERSAGLYREGLLLSV